VLLRSSASRPSAIAPAWHTAILAAVFAASGLFARTGAPATQTGTALAQAAVAAMLFLFTAAGMRLRGHSPKELVGSLSPRELVPGALTAAALLGLWLLLGDSAQQGPRSFAERALWLPVSAIVACSEELVFRGYLQRQFESFGAGFWISALAQAALFAAAHANQGWAALYAGICGLAFACLVRVRGGLAAAAFAHFALDASASLWP
jgi:membrane protease YdiL (CAAX protease family)